MLRLLHSSTEGLAFFIAYERRQKVQEQRIMTVNLEHNLLALAPCANTSIFICFSSWRSFGREKTTTLHSSTNRHVDSSATVVVEVPTSCLGKLVLETMDGNPTLILLFLANTPPIGEGQYSTILATCLTTIWIKKNSMVWGRERTIPTEWPPLIGEVMPTFADRGCNVVSVTDPYGGILGFLDSSRYFSIK
jgi:hypothetical protein